MPIHQDGERIAGRYEVVGHPMQGGMGLVYVCLDLVDNRPVALKTFRPEFLPDRDARDRFLHEGTAWVELGYHPHIVRCYRVIYEDPSVYLVLELIAKEAGHTGASLREWLTPGRGLGVEISLLFALQIVRGMQHACQKLPGFVHRDLKPENLLVGADRLSGTFINRLRVTDFGLAHVMEGSGIGQPAIDDIDVPSVGGSPAAFAGSRAQLTHGLAGTPLYMAPEQWRGEPVSVATDVYAFGCVLYEMLSGQMLVQGNTLAELKQGHCQEKKGLEVGQYPPGVCSLVKRCLAIDPKERYADWDQVEEDIQTAYAEVSGKSVPPAEKEGEQSREGRVADGWSYDAMGLSYRGMGKARVAIGYHQRAAEVGRKEGERVLEGAALGNLGSAFADLGEVRRAIGYYEQQLKIVREIDDLRDEGISLDNLGIAYKDLGEVRCAIAYHEQALVILREIGDQLGEGGALNNLGNAYVYLGEVRSAIGYFEQALKIAREIGDRRGEGADLGNVGNAYYILGEVRRAIAYYEQVLVIDREIGDRRGEGAAFGNLGIAYASLGEVQRAIEYFDQALVILREIGDRRGEESILGNLGSAYHSLGEAQRAIGYYEQALIIDREIADRRGEGADLGNLGNAYANLGEVQRAIGYYEQALIIHQEIGDANGVASVSINMAILYSQQGEVDKALPMAQAAAEIWQRMGRQDNARRAKALVEELQGGVTTRNGPAAAQVLAQFEPLIDAVVAAARGNRQSQAVVEDTFDKLEQNGWQISDPIRRIWQGERDQAVLIQGINPNNSLIIKEILNRLK